jgi:hypothetical protein
MQLVFFARLIDPLFVRPTEGMTTNVPVRHENRDTDNPAQVTQTPTILSLTDSKQALPPTEEILDYDTVA